VKPFFFAVLLSALSHNGRPLDAQQAGSGSPVSGGALPSEIKSINDRLRDVALKPEDKHAILSRLGRLLRLSGDFEGAQKAWAEAAVAQGETRDFDAILESAACAVALGEWETAAKKLEMFFFEAPRNESLIKKANFLYAQIDALRSSDYEGLIRLAGNPAYDSLRPSLYYSIWKITGNNDYKTKLVAEYPESPEARSFSGGKAVEAAAGAHWLLFPGRESIVQEPFPDGMVTQAASAAEVLPPVSEAMAAAVNTVSEAAPPKAALLQLGLFTRVENAAAQAAKLKNKGFSATVVKREISGDRSGDYYAVTVPGGVDVNETVMALKEAGFESFPVF
jgi:hypothetical protein